MKPVPYLLLIAILYAAPLSAGMLLLEALDEPKEGTEVPEATTDKGQNRPATPSSQGNRQRALVGESHDSKVQGSFQSRADPGQFHQKQGGRDNRQDLNIGGLNRSRIQGQVRTRGILLRGQQNQQGIMNHQRIGVGGID